MPGKSGAAAAAGSLSRAEMGLGTRYGLEIRAAAAGDAPGLSQLFDACGLTLSARDAADRLDILRREQAAALIAVEWGPPSGLVVMNWYRTLLSGAPVAQITVLLVAPDDRRRGIGRLLLKAAAQAARVAGCASLEALVDVDRPDSQGFCLATGFTLTGQRFARPLRKAAQP